MSPTQIVQNVTDTVSEKVTTHTQNFITKARSGLDVLRKFSTDPEEKVEEEVVKAQESNEIGDKAEF